MDAFSQPINWPTLESVINFSPIVVRPETLLIDAIALMGQAPPRLEKQPQRHSSCILVTEHAQLIGIVTAQDVVRVVAAQPNVSQVKVAEVMMQPVISLSHSQSNNGLTAWSLLHQHQIRHLPIVNGQGEVVGLVTQHDLLQCFEPPPAAAFTPPSIREEQSAKPAPRLQELELLSDQHRLEAFFTQSPDGFFFMMLDRPIRWDEAADQDALLDYVFSHQRITKVNAAMLAQYSAAEAEFMGLTPQDFFAHDRETGRQLWREMFDKGRLHVETFEQRLDGTSMWIEGDYSCLYSSDGDIIGHFGIQRDISESKRAELDRKRAEEKLLESQQALADFVENAIVCLHWVASDGTIIWANQAELDLLGYTREEYIGHSITDFHADPDTIADILQRLLGNQLVQDYEADLRCKDGSIRHVLIDSNSSWSNDEFVRTRCFTRDITDRKVSEIALLESEQRYASLAQGLPVGIFRTDAIGHCLYVNDRWCQMTGLSFAEAEQDGWAQALHPEDCERVFLEWYQCAQNRLSFQSEYRFQRKDGTTIWVFGQAFAELGIEGELLGYVGSITEISALKQAEAALIQSEQKFRAIFDSMFQFIGLLTPEGTVMEGNRAALDAIAADRADIIGKPFWETPWWSHSPSQQEELKQAITRAANGEMVRFEAEHVWADGTKAFVDFSLKPVFDDDGTVIMLIPEGRDMSDRKQAEIELQNQKQDLARSNHELQQFAYVASHDLQEPLRMITSYLELLERRYKGQLDDKADKFIAYAVDGATRMQTLINDLLSYSRVGTRGEAFESVDCAKILQHVLTNLQVAIVQSSAVITYDSLPLLNADSSQMTQLFQNLLSNAIKFRRDDPPQIHIGVKCINDKWLFSVRDNGMGIDTQYMDRIFVIFQRLQSRTEYPGTGIGLAVCKKIVERHAGTLWVESQLGQGSTFHFTLPYAGAPL
jgi:PAS domain S-box-containing protein